MMLLLAILGSHRSAVLTTRRSAMTYINIGSAPFSIAPRIEPVTS